MILAGKPCGHHHPKTVVVVPVVIVINKIIIIVDIADVRVAAVIRPVGDPEVVVADLSRTREAARIVERHALANGPRREVVGGGV